jgi:hypothetical protein
MPWIDHGGRSEFSDRGIVKTRVVAQRGAVEVTYLTGKLALAAEMRLNSRVAGPSRSRNGFVSSRGRCASGVLCVCIPNFSARRGPILIQIDRHFFSTSIPAQRSTAAQFMSFSFLIDMSPPIVVVSRVPW